MRKSVRLLRFALAVIICLVALARPSRADTIVQFIVSGTLTTGSMNGTTTFDETTNTMLSVDINTPGAGAGPFTIPGMFDSLVGLTWNGTQDGLGDYLFLVFPTTAPPSVAGYDGGALSSFTSVCYAGGGCDYIVQATLTPTPEPSTFSLFGLALLGLGIIGYKLRPA